MPSLAEFSRRAAHKAVRAAFNSCHGNWQEGSCSAWHYNCGLSMADFEEIRLLANGDAKGLRGIAERLGEASSIVFNEERGMYQLLDCRGNVAVQFRADPRFVASVGIVSQFAGRHDPTLRVTPG